MNWKRLKRSPIFQCRNCQKVGHVSANCYLKPVCPKCTRNHVVGNCSIKDMDKSMFQCVNSDQKGHSVAYKGCPMIKWTYKIIQMENKKKREETARKIAAIEKVVMLGISYANINPKANSEMPIIKNPQPVGPSDLGTTKQEYPSRDSNTDNESGNLNSFEPILLIIKNDIIREMQKR
ncbi:hypothetical protein M0802_015310 [Mischocyttarus mexicanus]|nr:hypothetical protein M0802_015310 [Mischocyttarus mexicanus]